MTDLPTPDIVDSPGQRFVGARESFDLDRRAEIPALFDRFFAARDGIEGARPGAIYGLSLDARPDGSFRYAVAVEVDAPGAMPEGFWRPARRARSLRGVSLPHAYGRVHRNVRRDLRRVAAGGAVSPARRRGRGALPRRRRAGGGRDALRDLGAGHP
ncbi:MAG: GyrI-like domain-containing protein [Paracoccaceae bacterium]